jgi:gliding motility-associated-like protein
MILFIRLGVIALSCLCSSLLFAQNVLISYEKCDSLFVCSADTFQVEIQNNQSGSLTGASFNLNLPAGLVYLPGSMQGAAEQNISNLAAPVFTLPEILAGQTLSLTFQIEANCTAADALDDGQLFIAQLAVTTPTGNVQVSTTSIPVETGALVIESVSPPVLTGERLDTLERIICLRNTRLGKIGNLYFEDQHLPGISIEIPGALAAPPTPVLYSAQISAAAIQGVGNGDAWLDQNESLCLTEKIVITDCGIPEFANLSTIRIGWGCGPTICRFDSISALVEIKKSTRVPELTFEQIWSPPVDYCGQTPVTMGYKIKNIGREKAVDVIFELSLVEGLTEAGILENTFRITTTAGATPLTPNVSQPAFLEACNFMALRQASLVIPVVPAGDSIELLFEVITCVEACDDVQPAFRADYFYRKDCPVNGFVSGNTFIIPETGYLVEGAIRSSINSCLACGQSYPFTYFVKTRYMGLDGYIHIRFDLPRSISIDTTCGLFLGGNAPAISEFFPQSDNTTQVHLAWDTPLQPDSLLMNFCLFYACDSILDCQSPPEGVIYTSNCCLLSLENQTWWSPNVNTPPACGIGDCDEQLLAVIPPVTNDSTGGGGIVITPEYDTIFNPNYLRDWWNVYRLNVGFRDVDDDRNAENLLPPINPRLDRFLAGDTLQLEYCGVIDSVGGVIDTIVRAIWHEIVGSDMGQNDNDIFQTVLAQGGFTDASRVRLLGGRLRMKYADGTVAECETEAPFYIEDQNYFQIAEPNSYPLTPIDDIATEKFYFIYSLPNLFNQGCLTKPYMESGDSIFVYTDFKLDVNFTPGSSNDPDPPLVGFRTASSGGGGIYAWNDQPRKYQQYSGWKRTFSPNAHNIKPCENSTEPKKFRYSLRIARENMFPFEVRPLAHISDYYQTVPPGLELATARVEYLALQDSVPFLQNVTLPFSQTPGFLHLDFSPVFAQQIDEGFTLRSSLQFKPNCQFNLPDTSKQYIETTFNGCLNGDEMVKLDSIKNAIGFFSNTPRIILTSSDTIVFSPGSELELEFDLINQTVSNAPATWISVVSTSGQTGDFELFQWPQNQPINGNDGFFNTGNISGFDTLHFKLKGQSMACDPDTLLIIFGWGCTPQVSPDDAACGKDTLTIILQLERPELELDILQEPDVLTLCDTSDWFEFEIFNAKIGYAYDLEAGLKLPQGIRIAPGSSQISYPAGAPFVNIADPGELPGNLYQWEVSTIQAAIAANGLPGVNLAPQHAFRIRFKVIAECGAVLNTPIIYGTTGTEACGRATNVLNKPGEPLQINGIDPSYGVQVSLQPTSNDASCGQSQTFAVTLTLLGTPSVGDSVYVTLPQGVVYVLDTYNPGQNAPAGPVTLNANGFQLPLPLLQGGGTIQFDFTVEYGAQAGCNDQIVRVQTLVRTEAFCQTLGAPCAVYVSTGEALWNIQPEHPQLVVSDAQFGISGGQINGTFNVSNLGDLATEGLVMQIWRDLDGSGTLTPGDVLMETFINNTPILPGESLQITSVFPQLDSTQLCGLLLVLPANENCSCDDWVLPLENIELTHTPLSFCNFDPVELGIPEEGDYTYAWSPTSGINCITCPNITYIPATGVAEQTLTLTASSAGCTIEHQFVLSFASNAVVITGDEAVCSGASVLLGVFPGGVTYTWEGVGIQNPGTAAPTVTPETSGHYAVTVTFDNGCTANDSLFITVFPRDTTVLPDQTACNGESVEVLGVLTDIAGTYQALFQNVSGCDSIVFQTLHILPEPLTVETRSFCAGDSLAVFDTLLLNSGEVCRVFTGINGCDSTHCIQATAIEPPTLTPLDTIVGIYGQIITLTGPDGYLTYVWQPAPEPPCVNCPSVSYPADSAGYQEYVLTLAGTDGCPSELVFRVFVLPPCSADSLRIPNAFSPNGDGANDVFRVVAHEGSEVISGLEIYDRWGEKVYENVGNAFWDGTIDGKPAPSDVYVYIVKVTCGNLIGKRVGDVTLLR